MARTRGGADLRLKGLGLKPRFVLSMTAALTGVMLVAAASIYGGASKVAETVRTETLTEAVLLTMNAPPYELGATGRQTRSGVKVFPITWGNPPERGTLYRYEGDPDLQERFEILVPDREATAGRGLLGIIAATLIVVVLVGAVVALWVASQVTRPVQRIIDDVRLISHGELDRKIRVHGAGEIDLLARSIERMSRDLQAAQEAEVELSIRERERDLVTDVRDALVPVATPMIEGFDVAAAHVSSSRIGGDFHDYVELEDGRVGLLVCDVSGLGMPAALIGATARAYLHSELHRAGDPDAILGALRRVNDWLVRDMKRGVYVSALYVLVDPRGHAAGVVCAGHKVPLIHYTAADGKLRTVQPEGIALGLDKGPVFGRRLETQRVPLAVGDRLFLSNSGPLRLENADGRELGEKALYGRVLKHAALDSMAFIRALRRDLEQFAGEEILHDISLVTIARES